MLVIILLGYFTYVGTIPASASWVVGSAYVITESSVDLDANSGKRITAGGSSEDNLAEK